MAFLNELTRGLKATGQTVAQKTKEIGEAVQVKSQINTEKETITRLYASIGKQMFESGCEEAEKKFFTEFASIRKAMNKITELEATLTDLDGCISCPECGTRIDKISNFCMKCGAAIEHKAKAEEAVVEDMTEAETAEETVEVEAEVQMEEAEAAVETEAEI